MALIKRAFYGGKVAGRDFWHHLQICMEHLGFDSCQADPDVWQITDTNPNGEECYGYALIYVGDFLVISHKPEAILRKEIRNHFKLREESIGPP